MPEVLDLALRSERAGRAVGVYIETKDPAFHTRMGLPLEERLVQALVTAGYKETIDVPVILQSFEEPVMPILSPSSAEPFGCCTARLPQPSGQCQEALVMSEGRLGSQYMSIYPTEHIGDAALSVRAAQCL